jgi:hypothetical protein
LSCGININPEAAKLFLAYFSLLFKWCQQERNNYKFAGNRKLPKAASYRMYALAAGKFIIIMLLRKQYIFLQAYS